MIHTPANEHIGTTTPRTTLVLGGCRSGKSAFAEQFVSERYETKTYLATMQAGDDELRERIKRHKEKRSDKWELIEEPIFITQALIDSHKSTQVFLVDCVSMWLTNMLMEGLSDMEIENMVENLVQEIRRPAVSMVFVSNEVGLGIVPESQLSRRFRDLAGWTNQYLASICNNVFFIAAGCPLKLK